MPSEDLKRILEAMGKPLRFASGNDFANLKTLKALEPYMIHWLDKASSLPLNEAQKKLIQQLGATVTGFDGLELALKKARIMEFQKISLRLEAEDPTPWPVQPQPTLAEFLQQGKDLQTPIQFIKGVGPRLSEILKKKNICTVGDALFFLPRSYEDRRQIKTISQLQVGKMETVIGTVLSAEMVVRRRRRTFEMLISDETGNAGGQMV